jgi:hypothetical protein
MRTGQCVIQSVLLSGAVLWSAILWAQDLRVVSVDPPMAKVGDIVTVNGEGIDKAAVDMLYLTDGKTDIKVEMTEQTAKSIKFKVPESAKSHRWSVMIHTTKDQLIEEPVRVTIE